jgi:hypothetical protein
VNLGDVFRFRHQRGHGAKRLPGEVQIQPRDYNPDTVRSQFADYVDDAPVEELRFVDAHNFSPDHMRENLR